MPARPTCLPPPPARPPAAGCAIDNRLRLLGGVVLSGGTTMLPGLCSRLEKELTQLYLDRWVGCLWGVGWGVWGWGVCGGGGVGVGGVGGWGGGSGGGGGVCVCGGGCGGGAGGRTGAGPWDE